MIPERIIFVSRGITVLNSGQHPERIKRFFYRNLREITFRLTNVIPERIIFVSRGITVLAIPRSAIIPKIFIRFDGVLLGI